MNSPVPLTKYFTVEEANRTLPLVRAIVRDIVKLHADDQRCREQLRATPQRRNSARVGDTGLEDVQDLEKELDAGQVRLQEFVDELADIGAELKDPAMGLVDFPTVIDDRDACLCWKLGEESIEFWHDVESGYSGRLPIRPEPE